MGLVNAAGFPAPKGNEPAPKAPKKSKSEPVEEIATLDELREKLSEVEAE